MNKKKAIPVVIIVCIVFPVAFATITMSNDISCSVPVKDQSIQKQQDEQCKLIDKVVNSVKNFTDFVQKRFT